MILSRKNTPLQFRGMWYAGLLNIGVSAINAFIFYNGGTWLTLFSACFSLVVGITILVVIKKKTREIIWKNLTKGNRSDTAGNSFI